ncbi:AAA family ATPase [Altererythrobacter soli]|uniref:AAA family ATPase n=1 Tax=Croceibacterium soli TaxID=1739690 RepID=A0A6I4UUE5_9SPHN|nr:Wzz/FepE/Etk N-terminal domain-containing protein [Croceibacterium soli]MXP41369.1 AAA family ATPase [Croceibacterium soli]
MNEARHLVPAFGGNLPRTRGEYLPAKSDDRLDLTETIGFFRRRLKLVALVVALVVAAGVAFSLLSEKVYTAEATVMLTNDATGAITADGVSRQEAISSELVDTQAEIIASREMAERVAASLGLNEGLSEAEKRDLIDRLQSGVSAERTGKSYALTIRFNAPDAGDAANIANEFARQFANWELGLNQTRNSDERELVQARLGQLRAQAQADTQALQQYRIAHNLLSTSGASLTEQEISNYNQEVTRARAEAAEDQARLQTALAQLRSGSTGDDVGEALGSPVISALRIQEAEAAGEVADLSSKYGRNHPQLVQAQSRLGEIRGQIQAEIERVISNLEAKQNVSAQRLASLSGSLSLARGNLAQNNAAMVGLSELERAAEASQGIYETYLSRYKELLAAEGSEKPNARILTFAEVPLLPTEPNLAMNLALSVVIGLGLGILAAYIAEALFHGMSTPEEVERGVGERHLASIPLLKSVSPQIRHAVGAIQEAPNSAFAESFRTLDTAIDQVTNGNKQIIALTSALPGEGKTIVSCCMSYIAAQSGQRTILIDCDLRRAGVSRLLDMQKYDYGLIEYLDGTAPCNLDELDDNRQFCVLPLRPDKSAPEHLLTGPAFQDLLERLRGRFDRIILDLPPVLPVASAPVLASRADATIMVAHWRKTSTFAIRAALRRLPAEHVNLVGVALNQVDLRRRAFFERGDPSFYYRQYREYYA